jgi:hypothetical protein
MNYFTMLEQLRKVDEVTLLELLDIESDDLIDAFTDKVQERFDYIARYLNDR